MSDQQPIEKLHDAIEAFVREIGGDEGILSDWVLSWQMSALTDEPGMAPLMTTSDYTVGPSTTIAPAMGLARQLVRRLDRIFDDGMPDLEEDD